MARLTAKARAATPKSKFAVAKMPNTGKPGFQLTDRTHDIKAEQFASRSAKAGNISPATAARVKREAKADLKRRGR